MLRKVDLVQLMGPPGAGKSTLGAAIDGAGIGSYTELEPMLVARYGRGEEFAKHRPAVHEWIWNYYRRELAENPLPVVMETTGISGRHFVKEVAARYRVLLVKLCTPRNVCIARVRSRAQGRHVNDHVEEGAAGDFFDHWHREIVPTYAFDLSVSGTDLDADLKALRSHLQSQESGPS